MPPSPHPQISYAVHSHKVSNLVSPNLYKEWGLILRLEPTYNSFRNRPINTQKSCDENCVSGWWLFVEYENILKT